MNLYLGTFLIQLLECVQNLFSYLFYCWCMERLLIFILILYPAIHMKLFIVSRNFLVEFLTSLMYNIVSSENRGNLTSSFSICITLIFCSCLIALSSTSSTVFIKKRNGDRGCLGAVCFCFVLIEMGLLLE